MTNPPGRRATMRAVTTMDLMTRQTKITANLKSLQCRISHIVKVKCNNHACNMVKGCTRVLQGRSHVGCTFDPPDKKKVTISSSSSTTSIPLSPLNHNLPPSVRAQSYPPSMRFGGPALSHLPIVPSPLALHSASSPSTIPTSDTPVPPVTQDTTEKPWPEALYPIPKDAPTDHPLLQQVTKGYKCTRKEVNGIKRTFGLLENSLKMVSKAYDAYATDSSSDEERDIEYFPYFMGEHNDLIEKKGVTEWPLKDIHEHPVSIHALDRVTIANKYNYSQNQITDLKFKQMDIEKKRESARNSKPPLIMTGQRMTTVTSPSTSATVDPVAFGHNVTKDCDGQVIYSQPDELKHSGDMTEMIDEETTDGGKELWQQKRKGDHADGLRGMLRKKGGNSIRVLGLSHPIHRKIVRSSYLLPHPTSINNDQKGTVHCHCRLFEEYGRGCCIRCQGTSTSRMTIDNFSMTSNKKEAIADPNYHENLSSDRDITFNTICNRLLDAEHMDKTRLSFQICRRAEKKTKKERPVKKDKVVKKVAIPVVTKLGAVTKKGTKQSDLLRKFKNSSSDRKRCRSKSEGGTGLDAEVTRKSSSQRSKKKYPLSERSADSSPTPDHQAKKRRRSKHHTHFHNNSYDIDNIVIPYHMAAAAKITKYKYKEIDTPQWREVDYFAPGFIDNLNITMGLSPEEDAPLVTHEVTLDEVYCQRHIQCEVDEKARYNSVKVPGQTQKATSRSHSVPSYKRRRSSSKSEGKPSASVVTVTMNGDKEIKGDVSSSSIGHMNGDNKDSKSDTTSGSSSSGGHTMNGDKQIKIDSISGSSMVTMNGGQEVKSAGTETSSFSTDHDCTSQDSIASNSTIILSPGPSASSSQLMGSGDGVTAIREDWVTPWSKRTFPLPDAPQPSNPTLIFTTKS